MLLAWCTAKLPFAYHGYLSVASTCCLLRALHHESASALTSPFQQTSPMWLGQMYVVLPCLGDLQSSSFGVTSPTPLPLSPHGRAHRVGTHPRRLACKDAHTHALPNIVVQSQYHCVLHTGVHKNSAQKFNKDRIIQTLETVCQLHYTLLSLD